MSNAVATLRSIWKKLPHGVRHRAWVSINALRDICAKPRRLFPVRAEGMKWSLPSSFVSESVLELRKGNYERDERDVLKTVLGNLNGSTPTTAIDLGSHIGRVALTLARNMGSDSRIICVEADRRTIPALRRNTKQIARQHSLRPITVVQGAIAAPGEAEAEFRICRGLGSGLASSRCAPGEENNKVVKVQALSLSRLLQEQGLVNTPYILSADIEGGEIGALRDVAAFRNCVGIAIELHEPAITGVADATPEAMVKRIEALGFELARDAYGNLAHRGRVYGFVRRGLGSH